MRDPKPILSQTGSPILPYSPPHMSAKAHFAKRYQSSKTMPLPVSKPAPPQMQPYQEKDMIDRLQCSLQKYRPRQASVVPYPYPLATSMFQQQQQQVNYNQNADECNSPFVVDKIAHFQYQNSNQSYNGPSSYNGPAYPGAKPAQQQQQQQQHQHQHQQYENFNEQSKRANLEFGNVGPLKIVNNQYNTPIGLYSNNNISEEVKKQVR
jgi:hypothetical protein